MERNILYVLQPSVNDGKQYLDADSNVNMARGIIEELLLLDNTLQFTILIPSKSEYDIKKWFNKKWLKNVRFHKWNYPVNAALGRFYFNIDQLPKEKFDVVWCNISELCRNFKEYYRGTPIVYCNYFMDTPLHPKTPGHNLFHRQVEGALCSDLVTFTCKSTQDEFFDSIAEEYAEAGENDFSNAIFQKKCVIWDFGFQAKEIRNTYFNSFANSFANNVTRVFFPNRITDPDYTNFWKFHDAMNKVSDKCRAEGIKLEVYVSNPSQKYVANAALAKSLKNYKYATKGQSMTRQEYINRLWSSDVIVTLFQEELYGGCANVEALYTENIVVMPRMNEYINRVPAKYPFFTQPTLSNLESILYKAIKASREHYTTGVAPAIYGQSSFEANASKVLRDLQELWA